MNILVVFNVEVVVVEAVLVVALLAEHGLLDAVGHPVGHRPLGLLNLKKIFPSVWSLP